MQEWRIDELGTGDSQVILRLNLAFLRKRGWLGTRQRAGNLRIVWLLLKAQNAQRWGAGHQLDGGPRSISANLPTHEWRRTMCWASQS